MGWPRTDVVDDPDSAITSAGVYAGAPPVIGVMLAGAAVWQRRRPDRPGAASPDGAGRHRVR
jgi:hypothetical protein